MAISKYEETFEEREFVGYGMEGCDPKWPGGAKIAVNFTIGYIAGSELSIEYGDAGPEAYLTEIPSKFRGPIRSDGTEQQFEYQNVGVARLLTLFKKYDMPMTWNVYTQALEQSPYWTKAIIDSGSEISCGGKRWIDYMGVKPEVEDEHIHEALETIQRLTGDKTLPHGWMVDRRSNQSIKLYAKAHEEKGLSLLYSSDSESDDLPYWTRSPCAEEGKPDVGLLMLPFSYDLSDVKFNTRGSGWASPKDFYEHLKDTFDFLYEEGEDGAPKMMTVPLHPHIIGRGGRCYYLEEFLQYIKTKSDVWVARRDDIAKHFASVHPYDPKKAFGQTPQIPC